MPQMKHCLFLDLLFVFLTDSKKLKTATKVKNYI